MKMIYGSYTYADQKKQRFSLFLAVLGSLSAVVAFSFSGMGAFSQVTNLPVVQTKEASNIQQTSAVLNGVINPNGYPTTYFYEYGETAALGSRTPAQTAGASNSSVPVPVPISVYDLLPNTQYSFVLVAQNQFGVSRTAVAHFATPGPEVNYASIPSVTTNAASDVYGTTAVLRGYAEATNAQGQAWFEYGTDSNSLLTATPSTDILPIEFYRTSNVSPFFTAKLVNLTPGTTYYFRTALRRNSRTGYGALMSFRTLGGVPASPDYSNPAYAYAYTPTYPYSPQAYSYVTPAYYDVSAYASPSYAYASPAYSSPYSFPTYSFPTSASYASGYTYPSYGYPTDGGAYAYYAPSASLASYSYGYPAYSSDYPYPYDSYGYSQYGSPYYSYANPVPYSATVPANVSQLASANYSYGYGSYGNAYQYPTYSYGGYPSSNQNPSVVNIYSYPATAGIAQSSRAAESTVPAQPAAPKTVAAPAVETPAPKTQLTQAEQGASMDQTSPYQNLTASVSGAAKGTSYGAAIFGFVLLCVALGLGGWYLWGRKTA